MTKVFISYSRKDKAFAEKLDSALKELNLDSWVDWMIFRPLQIDGFSSIADTVVNGVGCDMNHCLCLKH